jgi:hypothetical protein
MNKMTTQQVVQTSPQIEKLFDSLDKMWAAKDYAGDLKAKAKKVAPKARKQRKQVQDLISEINKSLWQDGVLPENGDDCADLYTMRSTLTRKINDAIKKKGCDSATIRNYTEAAELYEGDARATREEIRGSPIKASKKLDPNILSRIETMRADKRKKNRKSKSK